MNIEHFLKTRKLRKIAPDSEKSKKSVEEAGIRLASADNALRLGVFKFCIMESYAAMFHVSRAVLYRDGFQEKGHQAVYIYIREKYGSIIPAPVINMLNVHRIERHEANYGFAFEPNKADAETALKDAKVFVAEIKRLL
jgi:uncharacterized protein (UPF0332 family)